jgi:hypothetical protein
LAIKGSSSTAAATPFCRAGSLLRDLQATGEVSCHGKGPGARWHYLGNLVRNTFAELLTEPTLLVTEQDLV